MTRERAPPRASIADRACKIAQWASMRSSICFYPALSDAHHGSIWRSTRTCRRQTSRPRRRATVWVCWRYPCARARSPQAAARSCFTHVAEAPQGRWDSINQCVFGSRKVCFGTMEPNFTCMWTVVHISAERLGHELVVEANTKQGWSGRHCSTFKRPLARLAIGNDVPLTGDGRRRAPHSRQRLAENGTDCQRHCDSASGRHYVRCLRILM